jgi:hypothetical protein
LGVAVIVEQETEDKAGSYDYLTVQDVINKSIPVYVKLENCCLAIKIGGIYNM